MLRKSVLDINEQNKIIVSWRVSFLIGALLGAFIFILIFGVKVLDVTYDDWLYRYEFDLTQHYLGWRLFRASEWHFPIGLGDTGMYPYLSSVIFTDSIPLFAVIFKIISPILPAKFQYFGLFGIFSFMMQGGVAKLLLRKKVRNELICNIGAIFFVSCIAFVQRMFWQTALSAHFLLLIAMLFYVYRPELKSTKKRLLLWLALGVLAVSIHIYLYGMVSVMLAGYALLEFLDNKSNIKRAVFLMISYLSLYIMVTVVVFYILGGFYGTVNLYDAGSGILSAGINSFIDPKGYSIFFSKGEYSDFQLESLCYIGIAVGILSAFSFVSIIRRIKDIVKNKKNELIVCCILFVLFFVFAISPVVFCGDKLLFTMNIYPGFIVKNSWGIFRACGRFTWPIMYFIIYIAITQSQHILKKAYPFLLIVLMCFQLIEFSGHYISTHKTFNSFEPLNCPADIFYNYDTSEYKHIQLMQNYTNLDFYSDLTCYYEMVGFSRLATDRNMTISNFNYARNYYDVVQKQIDLCYSKLEAGKPDSDTLYVFPKDVYINSGYSGKFENVIELDTGYDIVLVPTK